MQAQIAFDPDTQDLVVVSGTDCLDQSIDILSNLQQRDDPAFPQQGLKVKGTLLGGNVAGISYPAIFRDLAANFATDDSFKSITVTDVSRQQDAVYIEFTVQPKSGKPVDGSINVGN